MAWFGSVHALLLVCALPTISAAEELPITIKLPRACGLQGTDHGGWLCDFRVTEGKETRFLRIILDFFVDPMKPKVLRKLRTLEPDKVDEYVSAEIQGLDRDREGNFPPGRYKKTGYQILKGGKQPDGFNVCSRYQDTITFEGTTTTQTRSHMLCWAVDLPEGTVSMMFLSLIEGADPEIPDAVRLDSDFDALVHSISLP